MKVAVIGSRNLRVDDLASYLPEEVTEIVSGGARGVDHCAREYALSHGIRFIEFLPEYQKYGHHAPLIRNQSIIEYADIILAFWDGNSSGTKYVIETCQKRGIPHSVYIFSNSIKGFKQDG